MVQSSLSCLDDLADGGVGVIKLRNAVLMLHLIDETLSDVLDLQAM